MGDLGIAPAVKPDPAEEMPVPFGIQARTGKPLGDLTADDLSLVSGDPAEVRRRAKPGAVLAAAEGVNPLELSSAGWGVVFARDADPQIKAKLKPLLDLRQSQAKDLYFEFEGNTGIRAGERTRAWVERNGAGFDVVQPELGVPLYLLLVGSPTKIPFEFQYLLDTYWNVGRLDFDNLDDYATYAANVVAYETATTVRQSKRAAIWCTKNAGDRATGLLTNQVALPVINGQGPIKPVGAQAGFKVDAFVGVDATKPALLDLLRGKTNPPALLFTGSHGVAFPSDDPLQRENQGALLGQEWSFGDTPTASQYLTGAEVLAEANAHGLMHFLFACYGGGCPAEDNFSAQKTQLMANPITARVPQALLRKGALAVLAHIDRAWAYSFQSTAGRSQYQGFRSVMNSILNGDPIGQATDSFNQRWSVLGSDLQEILRDRAQNPGVVSDIVLANRWVARDDARNYIILGDPAARLRVKDMSA